MFHKQYRFTVIYCDNECRVIWQHFETPNLKILRSINSFLRSDSDPLYCHIKFCYNLYVVGEYGLITSTDSFTPFCLNF